MLKCLNPKVKVYDLSLIEDLKFPGSFFWYQNYVKGDLDKVKLINHCLKKKQVILFPCRKCLFCLSFVRSDWSNRLLLERTKWNNCYFVTLTYDNQHCPKYLSKRDVQLFVKRLKKSGLVFKYFVAGEYGSRTNRPHYHFLLFTNDYLDLIYLKKSKKHKALYDNKFLSDKWGLGYVWIGFSDDVSVFKYVCKYSTKSLTKSHFNDYLKALFLKVKNTCILNWYLESVSDFVPEFLLCSQGLGYSSDYQNLANVPGSLLRLSRNRIRVAKSKLEDSVISDSDYLSVYHKEHRYSDYLVDRFHSYVSLLNEFNLYSVKSDFYYNLSKKSKKNFF